MWREGGAEGGPHPAFHSPPPPLIFNDEEAAISRCRRGAARAHTALQIEFIVVICPIMMRPHTHMLVLAVDVSQSAARPTISNPVES